MNERIKELYAKANEWALHNYPSPRYTVYKECY
jgi:hypothetical protein